MKKSLLAIPFLLSIGCSTGSKSSLNCEKLHADSEVRVEELKKILVSYQDVNYDLAVRLSPPLKEEVQELDSRIRKQKQRCWASEKKPIDTEMAILRNELFKVYGSDEDLKKLRTVASKPAPRKPASVPDEQAEIIESVELDQVD